jgi:hypothetical protein
MDKDKLKSQAFGMALAGFATTVFGSYTFDKITDFSLQVSYDRGRSAAAERAEIISAIRNRFQTTGVIENDPNFPISTGIEELTSSALPQITDNPEAQTELSKCEHYRTNCVAPTRGNCLTPRHSQGIVEIIKREYHDKTNYKLIRECSQNVLKCEQDLKQCVKQKVLHKP